MNKTLITNLVSIFFILIGLLVQHKSNEIFFCLGYCGWGKGQLENEIKEKSWIVLNEKIDFISKSIDWKRKIIEFDEKYKFWVNSNRNFHFN